MLRSPYFLPILLFIILSLPILFHIAPSFLVERPLPVSITDADELDDLALFSRAAASSSSISHLTSSSHKLKIAFLFLTNTDLYFAPLWQAFFKNHEKSSLFNIYIHADPSLNLTRLHLPPVFRNRFIPSKTTQRASPTLISATRRLLANAIIDDPANAYFAVLSQYCIPLHSFSYVYNSLFISPKFDRTDPDTAASRHGIRLRYRSYIEILNDSPSLWKRYTARGRYAMLPEVEFDQFRVGSQFFTLTRRHALAVVKDRALWRKFKLPCYREDSCYPEEHYFPTLLSLKDHKGCTDYTLTRVNWTGTVQGHPHTYRPGEVSTELIYRLRESNYSESYLFARKFAPECLKPLMKIASKVIFKD